MCLWCRGRGCGVACSSRSMSRPDQPFVCVDSPCSLLLPVIAATGDFGVGSMSVQVRRECVWSLFVPWLRAVVLLNPSVSNIPPLHPLLSCCDRFSADDLICVCCELEGEGHGVLLSLALSPVGLTPYSLLLCLKLALGVRRHMLQ